MRPRIGQLLLEAGRLSSADLDRGLAAQRTSGLRFGSTLVQLGLVTGDEAARALARQYGIPAALERHLAGRDPTLTARDPAPPVIADLRAAARMPIIASVACELVLRRELDLAYPPPVEDDSIDIDVDEPSQPFPSLGEVDELSLVELDDQYVVKDHSQSASATGSVPVIEKLAEKRQTAPRA
ncbi:MAG: hypothetical protein F9K40_12890, partial [Kofleriaceae bacterium]